MTLLQRIAAQYQTSSLRHCLRGLEDYVRPYLVGRSRIRFGVMAGMHFPQGDRGTLLGTYELPLQEVLEQHLNPGDIFYDVGGHHGFFSLLASVLVGPSGHVYSFEPLPGNAERIASVMSRNGVRNQTLVSAAVSDQCGHAELFLGDGNDYRPSLFAWKTDRKLQVRTIVLDEFVQGHRKPSVIKVDVEGAEVLVLRGANALLTAKNPPVWVMEIHSEDLEKSVTEIFQRHSYHLQDLHLPSHRSGKRFPKHMLAKPESK